MPNHSLMGKTGTGTCCITHGGGPTLSHRVPGRFEVLFSLEKHLGTRPVHGTHHLGTRVPAVYRGVYRDGVPCTYVPPSGPTIPKPRKSCWTSTLASAPFVSSFLKRFENPLGTKATRPGITMKIIYDGK